eukprot:TRINITY_DN23622_c0_g1_i1.p2 TRINITY_DN23622_c0_g1~~TRINITY_DN23622_c0_g1_i1.p2  ORF type:complete len:393 (-),score=81.46 TRINITY_DN23622_c0_g1_i1:114-1292(-)
MRAVSSAIVFALPAAAVHSSAKSASHSAFEEYIAKFGRQYARGSEEYEERQAAFKEKLLLIEEQNSKEDRLWTAGINHLSDWLPAEFDQMLGWRGAARRHVGGGGAFAGSLLELHSEASSNKTIANEIDWKARLSMSTDVPEQGSCGSCWAVATISMLEGRMELSRNQKNKLSVQQLVNCVPNPKSCGGSGGCDGATVELGMRYIQEAGLGDSASTPYTAVDGHCKKAVSPSGFLQVHTAPTTNGGAQLGLRGWRTLPENQAQPLLEAVQSGPVAISVGADSWSLYSHGIYDGCQKNTVINHAVTLFGYGEDKGTLYWNIRNSWGPAWGEDGFIRLLRRPADQEDQFCGTDNDPKAGVACKPYPKEVKVCGMCGLLYDSVVADMSSAAAPSN